MSEPQGSLTSKMFKDLTILFILVLRYKHYTTSHTLLSELYCVGKREQYV